MTRDERIHKLKNGSDTAIWAANEIERLEKQLSDFLNQKNWARSYTRARMELLLNDYIEKENT